MDLARSGAEMAIAQVCLAGADSATNAPGLFKDNRSLSEGVFSVSWESRTEKGVEALWGVQMEAGKVNLNSASAQELGGLLVDKGGVDRTLADSLAACILDWRDRNDEELTGGAEGSYYSGLINPYPCHNGKFDVVEELMLVKGVTMAIFARIRPYVTVYAQGAFGGRVVGRVIMADGDRDDKSMPSAEARAEFVCDDKGRKLFWHEY